MSSRSPSVQASRVVAIVAFAPFAVSGRRLWLSYRRVASAWEGPIVMHEALTRVNPCS